MRILHISDTHIGSEKHFNKTSLEKVMNKIEKENYDLLIHSGDITQEGKESQYKRAEKIFSKIDIPHIVIPGNHDKRSGGLALYKKYIGQPNGVFEQENTIVLFVDSAVPDSNVGRVGMVKFNMLKNGLRKHSDKKIKIVVLHHHTIPIPMAGRERNVLSNAGDLLDLFLRFDVDLVISGHRHYPNVYEIDETTFVNAGTTSGKKTRYGDSNSFNEIEVGKKQITITTNRIENGVKKSKRETIRKRRRVFYDMGEKKYRIIHMSNTFISSSTKFRQTHFQNALNQINSMNRDVIVHCGGIVKEGISKDYQLANRFMEKIDIPVVYTPAGRDINYLGYELFEEHFGEKDQTFQKDDLFVQGISSSKYDSKIGVIGEIERERLFEKLRARPETFNCVFLHHNVLPIPHAREKGLLEDSGDFLREAADENIDLILTGTSSHPFSAMVENTVVVNANSLSSVYQRSLYGNSFNVIDIYEKVIVVSEVNSLWGTKRIQGIWEREN